MTIAEMMIVFFVIAVLLSIVFINYRQIQRKTILDSEAYKLASDIRKQQSLSGLDDPNCPSDPKYKYSNGIYLVGGTNGYQLFSDCDADNSRDLSEVKTSVVFPNEVELESVYPDSGGLNIVFYPPNSSVLINDNPANETATIVIHLKPPNDAIKKTIRINKLGMIDID